MQSTQYHKQKSLLHVAIIMDGNGRWAMERGRPRTEGHRAGADAVRRVVEAAPGLGISMLTLYAFSSDNWSRPAAEVEALMAMFHLYLKRETRASVEKGMRISVIGRRDRLSDALRRAIESSEQATREGRELHLRIAIDYSSRDSILVAASKLSNQGVFSRQAFANLLAENAPAPDVDLLIRTGGEHRLSDFLLWECAYAELFFAERKWPDFDREDLENIILEFDRRERRFGALPENGVSMPQLSKVV